MLIEKRVWLMYINKIRISADATSKLRGLRQRTTLTPNLLCRMAMVASFNLGPIGPMANKNDDGQEFNAYTLLGADQPLYTTMLRLVEQGAKSISNDGDLLLRLRAHIDRGVHHLSTRVKTPSDAARLLAGEIS